MDLFTTDESDVFWVHVKLTNTLVDHAIDGYWWTNIAVPLHNTSRVLFPADYAAVSGAKDGKLSCVRFPEFPDDPGTLGVDLTADWPGATTLSGVGSLGLDNTHRFHTDHSYPAAYYTARENFIGMDSREPMVRAFMGIIDTETGDGTLHCQTQEQRGRKYWAWGNDPGAKRSFPTLTFSWKTITMCLDRLGTSTRSLKASLFCLFCLPGRRSWSPLLFIEL